MDYVRLVISDCHLGSAHSRPEQILDLLKKTSFDELVLAGDIIDFIKVPSFTKASALLFDFVMKLDKPVIYVVGNHDCGFKSYIGQTINNVKFVGQYDFTYEGRKYRIEHGDKYERGLVHWKVTIKFISLIQDVLERRFKWNLAAWMVKWFKNKKSLRRIWDIIQWNKDADVFIMGHTHMPEVVIWVDKNEVIKTYANTGDWIEHSTYIIIKDGQLRLRKYEKEK